MTMENKRTVTRKGKATRAILLAIGVAAAAAILWIAPGSGLLSLFVVVPFFLYLGWNRLVSSKRLFESGVQVEGLVYDIDLLPKGRSYLIEYSYSGKTFKSRCADFNLSPGVSFSRGQKITVFLDSKNPESFAVLEGSGFDVHA